MTAELGTANIWKETTSRAKWKGLAVQLWGLPRDLEQRRRTLASPRHGSRVSHATLARSGAEGVAYLGESYSKWWTARVPVLESPHHLHLHHTSLCGQRTHRVPPGAGHCGQCWESRGKLQYPELPFRALRWTSQGWTTVSSPAERGICWEDGTE